MDYEGVSLNRILSCSEFKRFNFLNPDSYLPMSLLYNFLQTVKSDQGINYLANTFYNDFRLNELGDFGDFITERPDLLTVITDGIKYESFIQTNTKMALDISGSISKFSQTHLDPFSKGRQSAENIAFAMAYKAFKMVLGNQWRPINLYIPGYSIEPIKDIVSLEDTNIIFGSPNYYWFFETELLSFKNLSMTQNKEPSFDELSNLSEHVLLLLNSLTDGYLPTRYEFSNFLNISESTIVRRLNAEGTSFSKLLERHLFLKAVRLIKNDKIKISEISQRLGYANTPNFIRAFRKWTNSTPSWYRNERK